MFACLMVCAAAVLFDQTMITYRPEIIMNRITPISYVFYGVYALFLLLPMILQVIGEKRFEIKGLTLTVR